MCVGEKKTDGLWLLPFQGAPSPVLFLLASDLVRSKYTVGISYDKHCQRLAQYCTIAEQNMIDTVPFVAAGVEQQPRFVSFTATASRDAMTHHVQKHSGVYAWHDSDVACGRTASV